MASVLSSNAHFKIHEPFRWRHARLDCASQHRVEDARALKCHVNHTFIVPPIYPGSHG